ncbi:MAG: hypothetical protein ACM3ZB_04730 [bacterium]
MSPDAVASGPQAGRPLAEGAAGVSAGSASAIGTLPYRIQLAGGWIDQPFVSRHNPKPPGSMVVVSVEPNLWLMDRAGMATGTRKVALRIWGGELPKRPLPELVRELYRAENEGRTDPSGSQDMIGLIYPGINRLDYDASVEGGVFPANIESTCDAEVARWLESVLHLVPVNQRPEGYSPLGIKNFDPVWVQRLGETGTECFRAIVQRDLAGLAASMNECMKCWEAILPHTVSHPTITVDLKAILAHYQARYAGAMYSGCGGGYLLVVSEEPVPGSFQVSVRLR